MFHFRLSLHLLDELIAGLPWMVAPPSSGCTHFNLILFAVVNCTSTVGAVGGSIT